MIERIIEVAALSTPIVNLHDRRQVQFCGYESEPTIPFNRKRGNSCVPSCQIKLDCSLGNL